MSYTVTSGDILEVTISGRWLEQRVLALFHYRYESTSPPANGLDTINTANTKLNTADVTSLLGAYAAAVSNEMALDEMVYQWIFSTRRARAPKSPARLGGTRIGDAAPSNIACFIEKLSDVAGRKGHGGLHLTGLTTDAYAANSFQLAYLTALDDLRSRMAEVVTIDFGIQLTPVIFNRTAPATSVDVTGTVVKEGVRTMHRRTVGLGE